MITEIAGLPTYFSIYKPVLLEPKRQELTLSFGSRAQDFVIQPDLGVYTSESGFFFPQPDVRLIVLERAGM
ncbi:hypothetical protein HQN90_20485 [Paenibacillus alba]|nr:hypothetical protein [Paenibacillus alba]